MISRIANAVVAWEGLAFLLSLLIGIGVAGYVVAAWAMYFAGSGHYLLAASVVIPSVVVALLAAVRAPIGLVLLWGFAVVSGVAATVGAIDVLLP